jgi:hypothetical protein
VNLSIRRSNLEVIPFVLLVLLEGAALGQGSPHAAVTDRTLDRQIQAIKEKVKTIDEAVEAPPGGDRMHRNRSLGAYQFTGVFEGSVPIFLTALFSQNQEVRMETYYLVNNEAVLARVEDWWDVDDPHDAPDPPKRRDFYIQNNQIIRRVVKVGSARPAIQSEDTHPPSARLAERAHSIATILSSDSKNPPVADALKDFPDFGVP